MYLGSKAKIGYFVSYIKLLLVNMNHLEFFFVCLKKFINKHSGAPVNVQILQRDAL